MQDIFETCIVVWERGVAALASGAAAIADTLEALAQNGGASIVTFEITGGGREKHKLIDNLKLFSLLANAADVKSW